jgi:hypothetical protein
METTTLHTEGPMKMEILHRDYNIYNKDNLDEIPAAKAVFGIFAIVNDEPANCRYTGMTEDIQRTVKDLFENPADERIKKFIRGPWIKMLQYKLMPVASEEEMLQEEREWARRHNPGINEEGEYPGYYD